MNVSRCLNTEWVRFAACAARSSGCSDCQTCRRCPAPDAALIKVSQRVSDRGDAVPPDVLNAKPVSLFTWTAAIVIAAWWWLGAAVRVPLSPLAPGAKLD